jgi:hypothetical protein
MSFMRRHAAPSPLLSRAACAFHHLAREYDHAHPVADRARKRIQTVGRRHVGDLGQIEIRLQRGIRITGTGLGLKKAEEAVPQPSIVAARASLLDLVD